MDSHTRQKYTQVFFSFLFLHVKTAIKRILCHILSVKTFSRNRKLRPKGVHRWRNKIFCFVWTKLQIFCPQQRATIMPWNLARLQSWRMCTFTLISSIGITPRSSQLFFKQGLFTTRMRTEDSRRNCNYFIWNNLNFPNAVLLFNCRQRKPPSISVSPPEATLNWINSALP